MSSVADLKPRGVKPPLHLVPMSLLRLHAATAASPAAPFASVPVQLLEACAAAFHDGACKYEAWNWLNQGCMTDMRDTYTGALLRHIHLYVSGEDFAQDSGVAHIGHAAACCAILGHHLNLIPAPGTVPITCEPRITEGPDARPEPDDVDVMDELVQAAHAFADPSVDPANDGAELARVVRCLGDLARSENIGYTEPASVRAKRNAEFAEFAARVGGAQRQDVDAQRQDVDPAKILVVCRAPLDHVVVRPLADLTGMRFVEVRRLCKLTPDEQTWWDTQVVPKVVRT